MNRLIRIFTILIVCGTFTTAGEISSAQIEWVNNILQKIEERGVDKMPQTKITGGKHQTDDGVWSHYIKKNGKITFDDNSWIIVAMHSAHANGKLGDISVIKTSKGDIYYSFGHYCAELILKSKIQKISSIEDFLGTTGLVPKKINDKWMLYKK